MSERPIPLPGLPLIKAVECSVPMSDRRVFVELREGGVILAGYKRHMRTPIGWARLHPPDRRDYLLHGNANRIDGDIYDISCQALPDSDEPELLAVSTAGLYRATGYLYGDRRATWTRLEPGTEYPAS